MIGLSSWSALKRKRQTQRTLLDPPDQRKIRFQIRLPLVPGSFEALVVDWGPDLAHRHLEPLGRRQTQDLELKRHNHGTVSLRAPLEV